MKKMISVLALTLALALACTGCSGEALKYMQDSWSELMGQSRELNDQLAEDAERVNSEILSQIGTGL